MSGSTAARREVSEWLKAQKDDSGDGVGRIEIDHVKEEERRIVLKEASGGQAFSITYQKDYPNSADEYLFLETDSKVADLVAVINDLRDFVYGQPTSLSLTALLDQLKRFLQKKSTKKGKGALGAPASSGTTGGRGDATGGNAGDGGGGVWSDGGSDGGDVEEGDEDEDGEGGEDEDDGNESDYVYEDDDEDEAAGGGAGGETPQTGSSWLDEHYKKRSWQSKEKALREEMAANKDREAKEDANRKGVKPKKVENLFTSKASSAVLTQDLLDIQRLEKELGMEVEAVDDNIFHWKVKINRVRDTSPLCEDLEKLRQTYAYGYVEMELTFTMDLYPFYPPLVKLVRPRFQGFMMGRITSLEMLQLSKWSSVRGMKGVLVGIRTALETWGRLDLGSELNDVIVHPEGSYTELEHLLMRLGLVTEIRPHASMLVDEGVLLEDETQPGKHGVEMQEDEEGEESRMRCLQGDKDEDEEGSSVERKRKRNAGDSATASPPVPGGPQLDKGGEGGGTEHTPGASQAKKTGTHAGCGAKNDQSTGDNDDMDSNSSGEGGGSAATSSLKGLGVKAAAAAAAAAAGVGGVGGCGLSGAGVGGRGAANGSRQYWAAGTGYGHSGAAGEKWDVEAYLAAQREQDRLKEDLLQEIAYLMRPDERHTFPEFAATKASPINTCSADKILPAARFKRGGGCANPEDELEEEEEQEQAGEGRGKTSAAGVHKGKGKARGASSIGGEGTASAGSSTTEASRGDGIRPGDGAAGGGGGTEVRVDSKGRKRKSLTFAMEEYRVDSVNSSLRVLEESCLVPFLQQLLENDSLLDVDRHAALYTSVFKLVKCIASWRSLHPLLRPMKGQKPGRSLYRLLSKLGDRAKVYRSTTSKGRAWRAGGKKGTAQSSKEKDKDKAAKANKANKAKNASTTTTSLAPPQPASLGTSSKGVGVEGAEDDDGALTDLLLSAVKDVDDVVDASFVEELEKASITRPAETRGKGKGKGAATTRAAAAAAAAAASPASAAPAGRGRGGSRSFLKKVAGRGGASPSSADGDGSSGWERYREIMGSLQYVEMEDLAGFYFKGESSATSNRGNPQRVKRLGQEHADLSQSLPLSLSSSVFVRTHEDQMDWMQVMISGPDDTPYSAGLFAFDIFFPHNYPQSPPKVKLMTTGGGTHRFNPNLYADGKVCLSLLGTWDGDRGESWNAQTSTLLQVLVSIQSLILVPQPFFNEPGYERQLGTDQGTLHSWEYNAKQREGTLRLAMLQMLQKPPAGFEDVVKGHFFLRRKYVEDLISQYISEAEERPNSKQHLARLQDLATQLKKQLATLEPPAARTT